MKAIKRVIHKGGCINQTKTLCKSGIIELNLYSALLWNQSTEEITFLWGFNVVTVLYQRLCQCLVKFDVHTPFVFQARMT